MDFNESEPVLTLDTDWAPDFVIDYVSTIIQKFKIKTTWFITHDSPVIQQLIDNPLYEIGLHPNFKNNSTQGNGIDDILKNLKKIAPNAKSIRTHGLLQSSEILLKFHQYEIDTDVSLFLEHEPFLKPHYSKYLRLIRIPYFWEDDDEMAEKCSFHDTLNQYSQIPGLKIFDFHPIHIFLNSKTFDNYEKVKSTRYPNIDETKLLTYRNNDFGVGTFFKLFLEYLKNKNTFTINDISRSFSKY